MVINQLLNILHDGGMPRSKTNITIPATGMTVEVDMLEEVTYNWLKACEFTQNITAEHIYEGIAHDVVLEVDFDSLIQIVEVK